jgi:GNAT superfamily N-acetyltransferase
MEKIIDVHLHVGHRYEWTERACVVWMDTGPYVPSLFDEEGRQNSEAYGSIIKKEAWAGILIPEYSPRTAGVMPFERAVEIARFHPELVPRALKIHPIHGFFFANDKRLYPVYKRCEKEGTVVMFHAGTSLFPGCKMRYADPYTFDDVISDFPDMTVVLCHGGRGFWYHIADFMAKRFPNVYIDISGLPPGKLLEYFPSLPRNSGKFLFGSDFPGVPGIKKNYRALVDLAKDDDVVKRIAFQNAYDLFGFWKEGLFEATNEKEISRVINDAAGRYKGVIPDDCWHEPYMPMASLASEMTRMRFYGYRKDTELLGVMGKEPVKDTTLRRHAYVSPAYQGKGIGSALLRYIEGQVETEWLLVGTWKAATWAIDFYRKHGYVMMENKDELLRRYWAIPERQIETSVVLGKQMRR